MEPIPKFLRSRLSTRAWLRGSSLLSPALDRHFQPDRAAWRELPRRFDRSGSPVYGIVCVENHCVDGNTWRCSLAVSLQALRQPEEPWISETHDFAYGAIPFVPSDNNVGCLVISPSLVTANDSKPTSMPSTESWTGKGSASTMQEKQAYHLPPSFFKVSVLTSPARGRCSLTLTLPILHTIFDCPSR